ncbi:cupin [Mesorhizobium sp. SEMIA 3007]|uniref:AraC family transcriptional regulator n=1 Tax=Mesorhizobium jarvisii TaxID=1777867 RepID=A0A6M7TH48_9HYPH|nr:MULTISPECIES: AraC family transcriptional regulator [Mesorhizobium]ANN58775.1 cupin [Mesorhizobium loti NZP2037]OBQ64105.1 cupin [Mesorhizobium loti]ODA95713.1 cupin [Mesorhizobium sp. SEMIA 3007]QKC64251.1 AraC family transcriptional regulator [Mesorhizobium jarvisii]QKD10164.1 AraC family transcriptional regulator [Mesorhizobium loti]
MDILAEVLDRVRLGGTLLFHFELGHPWNLALPARPYALFHYLSRGSATLALENGRELHMTEGDFVVVTRGEPHVIYSDRRTEPLPILDIDRLAGRLGLIRHGGGEQPLATMICGNFTVARPSRGSVLELLPPLLLLKPTEDGGWLDAILQRMVSEAAHARPGQGVALSRLTEVLFVEVLRSWIKSLDPGEGGWLGAMADPHIGPALQLIHERPDRPWTLGELGQSVGLGRSAFSARFTKLVGESMYRYLISRRMSEAAFLLETSDEGIARIAARVGYETAAAFSKLFHRHHGLSPGRYRAARRSDGGRRQEDVLEAEVVD